MSSTNKTANYQLSQFVGTDIPSILNDYNGDMRKIDTAIKEVANAEGSSASDIAGLQATVGQHTTEIGGINSTVNTLSGRVLGVESKIPANASESNKLITAEDISEIPSIEDLEQDVLDLKGDVRTLRSDISDAETNINSINADVRLVNNRIDNIIKAKPFYYQPTYDSSDTLFTRIVKCFEAMAVEYPSYWNTQKLYQLFGNIVIRVGTSFFHIMDTPSNFEYIKLDCTKFTLSSAGVLDELYIQLGIVGGTGHMPTSASIKELIINGGAQTPTDVTTDYNDVNVAIYVNALPYEE